MGETTGIQWTDHTFNPWVGCTRVSPGCQHCYAETMMDHRYGKVQWGPQGRRIRTSYDYWRQPAKWNRKAEADGVRRRVFVASLADVFENKPDQRAEMDEWREALFHYPHLYDNLDWLFLTKRPENVMAMVCPIWHERGFPANVWIGASVENQEQADKRIPELMAIPAAVHFLSAEPLLGPIELPYRMEWMSNDDWAGNAPPHVTLGDGHEPDSRIDWVIVGGESGHGARPMNPDWVRSLRDQCQVAGVPFHFKQWGEYGVGTIEDAPHPYSGQVANIPGYGSVGLSRAAQVWPNGEASARIGKKRAGRLLDGREWNEFPTRN